MPLPTQFVQFCRKMANRGLLFALAYGKDVLWFDVANGTDTIARKTDNGATPESIYYVPSFTSVIEQSIEILRDRLGEEVFNRCQFVDIGSGKGKVVLVYARRYAASAKHPAFGIEYDPELAAIANRNLVRLGFECQGIKIHHNDARNVLDHVSGERLILFLYNPFFGSIFHELVARLAGVPHVMIYVDPVERDYLVASGYIIEHEHVGRYNANTWIIASKWS